MLSVFFQCFVVIIICNASDNTVCIFSNSFVVVIFNLGKFNMNRMRLDQLATIVKVTPHNTTVLQNDADLLLVPLYLAPGTQSNL